MGKWWREISPIQRAAVVGAVVFAFYFGGQVLITRESLDSALFGALVYSLLLAAGTYFGEKRLRRTKARLDEHGQSLMFLRYPNARPGSLSGIWEMGIATPAPGRIDFQPAVYDELIPSGRSKALTGLKATGSPPRKTNHQNNKHGVPFGFMVITFDSDGGLVEIAAAPGTLQQLYEAIELGAS